jgi:DNA-binding transcriptional ArsR family regulator
MAGIAEGRAASEGARGTRGPGASPRPSLSTPQKTPQKMALHLPGLGHIFISVVGETPNDGGVVNRVFQALRDPTRREILRLLRARDMSAGELAERFPLAKSTLSGHFNVLKHAGLIVQERRRTSIVYSLNTSALEEVLAGVLALTRAGSDGKEASS